MNEKICLYLGIGLVLCIAVEAVFEHITNVLQSATGYEVFADMRMRLGNHLRKLPMGYLQKEIWENKHGSMYRHGVY